MTRLRIGLCALVVGALLAQACSDDTNDQPPPIAHPRPDGGTQPQPDGGTQQPDGGTQQPDGGTQGTEFTTFTRELILNQTADNNLPTTTEDKTFVDTAPSDAFPPAFFQ